MSVPECKAVLADHSRCFLTDCGFLCIPTWSVLVPTAKMSWKMIYSICKLSAVGSEDSHGGNARGGLIIQCESYTVHSVSTFPLLQRRAGALCVFAHLPWYSKGTLRHCLRIPCLWCCIEGVCLYCSKGQISWLLINTECSNHLDRDANHTLLTDFDHLFTAVKVP